MRTIEIDNLILVEVPKDANVEIWNEIICINKTLTSYLTSTYEIIGLIETPNLEFDFEVENSCISESGIENNIFLDYTNGLYRLPKEDSFRTRIQRKIQDAGLYLVNPICINGQTFSNEHKNKWQQAEEKTIKGNLLLIKKLK